MKWLTFKIQRSPGFRFNLTDLLFILLLSGLSLYVYSVIPELSIAMVIPYLGFSFFLFCNVFRISNKMEFFWYTPFALITIYCLLYADITTYWYLVLFILEPIKWSLVGYTIIKGPYLGIFSRYKPS